MIHMRYDDVIGKLRSVSMAGHPVKLVIARKVQDDRQDDVEISDVHVSHLHCMLSSIYVHVHVCACLL